MILEDEVLIVQIVPGVVVPSIVGGAHVYTANNFFNSRIGAESKTCHQTSTNRSLRILYGVTPGVCLFC